MEPVGNKNWAHEHLIDPLNEPEPSAEAGPGTNFRSTVASQRSRESSKSKHISTTTSEIADYATPIRTSPNRSRFSSAKDKHEENLFRTSSEIPTSSSKSYMTISSNQQHDERRRSSTLREGCPGDESARPLDVIRKISLRAQRSPHLRKDHHHGIDSIDKLAGIEGAYHHGGPFDVVSKARNVSSRGSPAAALKSSNAEALRATPKEAIIDALRHHRPIDGVADLPPGVPDRTGRVLYYTEGHNMQRGTGENVLGQWPAYYDYHPDDIKGKGEPSFTIERSLKRHDNHQRAASEGFEMTTNPRIVLKDNNPFNSRARAITAAATTGRNQSYQRLESDLDESQSSKGSLPRELGSLRRRNQYDARD